MEFKGTKKEWTFTKAEYSFDCPYVWSSKGICIAIIKRVGENEEINANAQLIANAPKMLEMLQLTIIELESGAKGHWEITGMIKEVINQATKIN